LIYSLKSYDKNKPYFNLDDNDILTINKPTTLTDNITVVGTIYNNNLSNQLTNIINSINSKGAKISLGGSLSWTLGQPQPNLVYTVIENGTSYPINETDDIRWTQTNGNINLFISDTYKNNLQNTLDTTYAKIVDVANLTQASQIFLKITDLAGTYLSIINAQNTYQTLSNMANYPTLGTTLLHNYNTQTTTAAVY
jgi:hypothetical protein